MIVCSCNVLSDDDVRNAVNASEDLPRNPKQIYGCLGCSAECGRCARTIKTIIDEALGACAQACCSGCPHSRPEAVLESERSSRLKPLKFRSRSRSSLDRGLLPSVR
ncbi:MAG: bacterioferritin [Alphaproteobacteria bacterium]|nr:MAG: bacterioferritin [Alphaproteobacteria bacterium]